MTAFAETDITMTSVHKFISGGLTFVFFTATFGDGSLTYATGGVPCGKGKFGLPTRVLDVIPTASSTMYEWEYDITNSKIKLIYDNLDGGSDGPQIQVANGAAPAATTIRGIAIGY